MAQKVQVVLTDDLDGSAGDETLQFVIDGVTYEIDLSAANAEALREALDPYVRAGRRVGGRRQQGAARKPSDGAAPRARDVFQIRAWAREQGYQVPDRGRISSEIKAAYEAAH